MRYLLVVLVVMTGCLPTLPKHNPMHRSVVTTAAVVSSGSFK